LGTKFISEEITMNRHSILQKVRPFYAILVLMLIGGAMLFGGMMRAGAQTAPAPTLVDSIITSTQTDKPPRFCWVQQYSRTLAREPAVWQPIEETKARAFDLDEFRGGDLDFGTDFTETNIVVPHPIGGERGVWRLHRVACPQPVAVCPGGDPYRSWCAMAQQKLLQARFMAMATMLTNPALRDQIYKSLQDGPPPKRKTGFLGGLFNHVTVGVSAGGDHGGARDSGRPDKPPVAASPSHSTDSPHD
jgi:hypothetical protein